MRVGKEKQKQMSLAVYRKHLSHLKNCHNPCLSTFVTYCYPIHSIGHWSADTGEVPRVREGPQETPEAAQERLPPAHRVQSKRASQRGSFALLRQPGPHGDECRPGQRYSTPLVRVSDREKTLLPPSGS